MMIPRHVLRGQGFWHSGNVADVAAVVDRTRFEQAVLTPAAVDEDEEQIRCGSHVRKRVVLTPAAVDEDGLRTQCDQ